MRHGIVEGEPGSMPWGQWWLRRVIRDRVRGPQDRRPEAEPGRSGTEQAAGEDENAGGGTPTS